MELHQLEAFLAVVDEHGFAPAARRLHVSRPALSQRVAALESSIGSRLFRRVTPTQVTAAGRLLEPHARRILGDVNDAVSILRSQAIPMSRLTVGVMAGGAGQLNAPLFAGVRRALPRLELHVIELPVGRTEAAVREGYVDVAILHPPINPIGLATVRLLHVPQGALAGENCEYAAAQSLTIADILDTCIARRGAVASPAAVGRQARADFRSIPLVDGRDSAPIAVRRSDDARLPTHVFIQVAAAVAASCREMMRPELSRRGR